MTTTKTFTCNLCRDRIKPSDLAQKDGFGLYFLAGGQAEFRRMGECENHICNECAQSVHDELRKVTPA